MRIFLLLILGKMQALCNDFTTARLSLGMQAVKTDRSSTLDTVLTIQQVAEVSLKGPHLGWVPKGILRLKSLLVHLSAGLR